MRSFDEIHAISASRHGGAEALEEKTGKTRPGRHQPARGPLVVGDDQMHLSGGLQLESDRSEMGRLRGTVPWF